MQSLLQPVKDEEDRLKMIAGDLIESDAVKPTTAVFELLDVEVQSDAEKQVASAQDLKDKD